MFHIPLECLSPLSRKEDCGQISREDPASAPHSLSLQVSLPVSQSHADSAAISCRRRAFRRDFKLDCCVAVGSIYVMRWHWLDLPAQLESTRTIPLSRWNFADQLPVCSLLLLRSKLAKMTKMTSLDRPRPSARPVVRSPPLFLSSVSIQRSEWRRACSKLSDLQCAPPHSQTRLSIPLVKVTRKGDDGDDAN